MDKARGRILLLGINFAPEPIGIGKYTGEFAESLVQEGFEVSVVTAYPHYPWWRLQSNGKYGFAREEKNGMTIIRCPILVPGKPGGLSRILQDLSFFITSWMAVCWLLLSGRRFDWIFTVIPSFPTAFLGLWVKTFSRKARWVVHVMDFQIDAAVKLGMIRKRWLIRLLTAAERWVFRRADAVSSISEGMLCRIGEKGVPEAKRILFPNWVDLSIFHPGSPTEELLVPLGLPDEGRMILYSGAIGEKQCLELIPQVASSLSDECPDIYFVIAGEGPYRDRLEAMVHDAGVRNIYFIPIQPQPVFVSLLRKAWLHLVLQRDTESELFLPSKLGPIMAVGGSAIVTASPPSGLGLLLKEHRIAHTLHPTTASKLRDAIRLFNHNPSLKAGYHMAASDYALRYLERGWIIKRYLQDLGSRSDTGPPTVAVLPSQT